MSIGHYKRHNLNQELNYENMLGSRNIIIHTILELSLQKCLLTKKNPF